MSFPIGFVPVGDSFSPVAVLGLQSDKNLFVGQDGRWLGGYIPAVLRGFPFLLRNVADGRQVLCINDAQGSLSDNDGEAFFEGDRQLSQAVKDILNFLSQVFSNSQLTQKAMVVMQKHKLITPWTIKFQRIDKQDQVLEGFYCVDEKALNCLSAEALQELQQSGALLLSYCQLLSMQHLQTLGKLAQAQHEAEQIAALPKTESGELDLSFLADDTTISFDNM